LQSLRHQALKHLSEFLLSSNHDGETLIIVSSNKLSESFFLCLLVILMLFLLSLIPEFNIASWRFKKTDLLSDVQPELRNNSSLSSDSAVKDTLQVHVDSVAKKVNTGCPKGITCIEDYSGDSTAMLNFIRALKQLKEAKRPVRIAMYGDSFIEGDVLCGSLRDTLQSIFGGNGVGYVPIASEVTGFRRSIKHQFENWETFSIIKKDSTQKSTLGPAGFCFLPMADNKVEYKPVKQHGIKEFNIVKLYYRNFGKSSLDYTVNDTLNFLEDLPTSSTMQEWIYNDEKINSIEFSFTPSDSLEVYGASFESHHGIYVDNFSMRGNSGVALDKIPDEMMKQFNQFKNYKLIILQYGLNVVREDSTNYKWYVDRMVNVVGKLKKNFPKASILLLSVSDRSTNTTGEFKTMKGIPALRNAQRYIAQKTGIAFWDMYAAMGGENSMVEFVEANPPLAAKDYTHLTFKGGRKIARQLVNSLLYEQKRHERK
jgi:hypothetical protein